MKVGDKVRLFLDKEIEKAENAKRSNPYVHSSVVDLWRGLNGRIGIICEIDGNDIWVEGSQGMSRLFREDVLVKVDDNSI
jgi:hypothetical protein